MTIDAEVHATIEPPAPSDTDVAGFATHLRAATHAVHREAERSGFIADLLRGRATRQGYAVYLANLLPAYEIMEAHLSPVSPVQAIRAFSVPGLSRAARLRGDIQVLTDESLMLLPEAEAYASAIAVAARGRGIGLVAHAYARYLGDLSGGQILKPLLARTLELSSDALTFYDFPDIADIAACKASLRAGLDTIVPGSADAATIVEESIGAFRHTIAVSTAVSKAILEMS